MNQSFRGGSLQRLLSESNVFVEELLTVGYESMPPSKRYMGVKVRGDKCLGSRLLAVLADLLPHAPTTP